MNMRNYMKKNKKSVDALSLTADELIASVSPRQGKRRVSRIVIIPILALCVAVPAVHAIMSLNGLRAVNISEGNVPALASVPIAAATAKKDLIAIPSGTIKANPFLPYREIGATPVVSDVPKFDLVEPPDVVNESSDAARVMDTVVSGILYDKYSPSAILNIEGNDYLVKKGDVVNNYKVVNIMQDSVTVKLGSNTFKAGIGEILTEGSVNYNDVSNLNKKFGGERK